MGIDKKNAKNVTQLLRELCDGDESASSELYELVYPQLQSIARIRRSSWSGNHTMSSTALVNEAYLKLSNSSNKDWKNRTHFFRVASGAMLQILKNYRAKQRAEKRGGDAPSTPFDDAMAPMLESAMDLAALEQSLQTLEGMNKRLARVFECRRLGGLSIDQTAKELNVSVSTVKRDSVFAEAWLRDAIRDDFDDPAHAQNQIEA